MADIQQPASPRLQALQNLQGQLPVANSRIAQGQQAARQMQLQQAVAQAPQGAPIQQTAQQTGAGAAQNAGEQMVERAKQAAQQTGQIGQLGLQQQQQQAQGQVASQQQGVQQQAMDNVQKLAALDSRAKQEVYDAQLQFQKDEAGRTLFNERQLADYARSRAQSDEEYKNYAQAADQASQRRLEAMEVAFKNISQDLEQKYQAAKQQGDYESQRKIAQTRMDMEAQMERERARRANSQAAWTAGGAVAGGVAGAVIGQSAAGGSMGATIGQGVGGLAGSQFG